MMNRRQALRRTALLAAATVLARHAMAQTAHWEWNALSRGDLPFKLPRLPYASDALEPHIDGRTMESHHARRHAAYVTNFNKTMAQAGQLYIQWKYARYFSDNCGEAVVKHLNAIPEKLQSPVGEQIISGNIRTAIRNNAGGHYNHSLFWQMMKKNGGGAPRGELAGAVNKHFGSFGGFRDEFTKAALSQFGSGWAWLTLDGRRLRTETTANEDTPLSAGREVILGIDVWEHAYYLKYQNTRADYVAAWFNVIDWDFVADRYARLNG